MFDHSNIMMNVIFLVICTVYTSDVVARDPTRPSFYKTKTSKKNYKLESILIGKSREVAIINGAVVAVGDNVEGSIVTHINKNSVRINNAGKIIDLRLHTATVRQGN